jgi:hypothetical protein
MRFSGMITCLHCVKRLSESHGFSCITQSTCSCMSPIVMILLSIIANVFSSTATHCQNVNVRHGRGVTTIVPYSGYALSTHNSCTRRESVELVTLVFSCTLWLITHLSCMMFCIVSVDVLSRLRVLSSTMSAQARGFASNATRSSAYHTKASTIMKHDNAMAIMIAITRNLFR